MPSPETLHLPTGGPTPATPLGESATEAGAAPSDRRLPRGDVVPGCGTYSGDNVHGGPSESGKKGNKPATEPFALAESLPMIPATLVDKILKGQYVDMCDLLQDNILLSKMVVLREVADRNPAWATPSVESGNLQKMRLVS